jgi:NADPH:quinone reductase-like Zn-dependent oxidoreductase
VAAKGKGALTSSDTKIRFAAAKQYTFKAAGAAKLPATAGSDGAGVVTEVGSGVKGLAAGDTVVPIVNGLGGFLLLLAAVFNRWRY